MEKYFGPDIRGLAVTKALARDWLYEGISDLILLEPYLHIRSRMK
jgi:hypothetical protein